MNINLYACIMPMFMLRNVTLKDTSTEWKRHGPRHAKTSMDKTLEAGSLGGVNVVLDVWYYYCAYVVYVVQVAFLMLCACGVVYI